MAYLFRIDGLTVANGRGIGAWTQIDETQPAWLFEWIRPHLPRFVPGVSLTLTYRLNTCALAGTGLAVVIWFGIFGAFGGAFFQKWQVEAGVNALRDASFFALQQGVVWLIIRADD